MIGCVWGFSRVTDIVYVALTRARVLSSYVYVFSFTLSMWFGTGRHWARSACEAGYTGHWSGRSQKKLRCTGTWSASQKVALTCTGTPGWSECLLACRLALTALTSVCDTPLPTQALCASWPITEFVDVFATVVPATADPSPCPVFAALSYQCSYYLSVLTTDH